MTSTGSSLGATWPPATSHGRPRPGTIATDLAGQGEADDLFHITVTPMSQSKTPATTPRSTLLPTPRSRGSARGASRRGRNGIVRRPATSPSKAQSTQNTDDMCIVAAKQGEEKEAEAKEAESDGNDADAAWLIFVAYSTELNGQRFMNGPDLECFFEDLKRKTGFDLSSALRVHLYSDQLQLQKDTRFRYNLSRVESSRGLCFESFRVLLTKAVKPSGVATTFARSKHLRYAGIASRSRRHSV